MEEGNKEEAKLKREEEVGKGRIWEWERPNGRWRGGKEEAKRKREVEKGRKWGWETTNGRWNGEDRTKGIN